MSPRLRLPLTTFALLAVTLVGGGCRCGRPVTSVQLGFRASPDPVDFGRVLEGDRALQVVTISSETTAPQTLTLSTALPFSLDASVVELPGGSDVQVLVGFLAGDAGVEGRLDLTSTASVDGGVSLTLRATGVHPPTCVPSGPCIASTYSLAQDRCLESGQPDETPCDPGNICLELGRCKAGVCLGVSRSCDDGDACTVDGCAATLGCVHPARVCPVPTALCRVPTCDPKTGCGEAIAGDGSPCGSIDCTTVHVCLKGLCIAAPTPEGAPCGVAAACEPAGSCRGGSCVMPPPIDWTPEWTVAHLDGRAVESRPTMLAVRDSVYFPVCGLPPPLDAGLTDAGTDDAGLTDAGTDDGGLDASTPDQCGLVSYFGGFARWDAPIPFPPGEGRRLVHVSPRGVLLLSDAGLEYRSPVSGAVVDALPLPSPPASDAITYAPTGEVDLVLPDGTLLAWPAGPDAGAVPVAALGASQVLTSDVDGTLYAWDPDAGVLSQATLSDAGLTLTALHLDGGARGLTASYGWVVAGERQLVAAQPDGGGLVAVADVAQAGWEMLPDTTLQHSTEFSFFRTHCPLPSVPCAEEERLVSLSVFANTGDLEWQVPLLRQVKRWRLVEPMLVALPVLVVAALSVSQLDDGGSQASLDVVSDAGVVLHCPLPAESADVRGALFNGRSMVALVRRPDAGLALESYPLYELRKADRFWASPEGVNGWRRGQ